MDDAARQLHYFLLSRQAPTKRQLLDSGTGELKERTELNSYQTAAAVLKSYHECITYA